jgi:hypothetical protein
MRTGAVTAVTAAVAALASLMGGCAGPSLDPGQALAGACQFKPCVCADEDAPFWQVPDTAEIVWGADGRPSCPPGFALQRKEDGG